MGNLIRSHFARLWRAPVFWLAVAVSAGAGLCMAFIQAAGLVIFPPACCAVVFSLFFGTEYADGTIRNKLTAGHSRTEIYLSALAVSILLMWLFLALSSPQIILTARFNTFGHFTPGEAALAIGTVMLASAAVAAALTALCMLIHRRTVLALALVFLVLCGILLGAAVWTEIASYGSNSYLEIYEDALSGLPPGVVLESYDADELLRLGPAEWVYVPAQKPPALLTFAGRLLPTVQALQALDLGLGMPLGWDVPLWSLAETALVTALGLALFKRKDIR